MKLLLLHPVVSRRSCEECKKYLFDDKGPGQFGETLKRVGLPVLRPAGSKPPCHWCPKVPAGEPPVPASAVEISPRNELAYGHYLECQAVNSFPDDPIVRRNAVVIRNVENMARHLTQHLAGMAAVGRMVRGE